MPFLRVLRDKRGYETTYLMHWFREGSRQRSRVLYLFRTPGGVRVGRVALEPDVLRLIEQRHPDIAFDWHAILEQQQVIESAPEVRRRRPRRDEAAVVAPDALPAGRDTGGESGEGEASEPDVSAADTPVVPAVPAALEGETPAEQMAFLDRTYPAVRERIATRVADPARRDVLLALADRLNPTAWTDADQITTGLQQASEALARLSIVLGRRRRRGRKRAPVADGAPVQETAIAPTESDDGPS